MLYTQAVERSTFKLLKTLKAYEHKYPSSNSMRAIRGLIYWNDIIKEPIDLLKGKYEWSSVEKRLNEMIKNENVKFTQYPFDER